jgi:hypothetical protein
MAAEAKVVNNQENVAPEAKTEVNPQAESKENSKEFNFRRLEQEKKEAERRLLEQERLNRELQSTLQNIVSPTRKEEELPELSPDDIPEWKHVQKYAEKIAEKKFEELLHKRDKETLPQRARQRFADFDLIVTEDNVRNLEQNNPELAAAITKADDPYSATYSAIKNSWFYNQGKSQNKISEEVAKIEENSKKPISSNAVGRQGALSNVNGYASKSKEQLYREMMQFANK